MKPRFPSSMNLAAAIAAGSPSQLYPSDLSAVQSALDYEESLRLQDMLRLLPKGADFRLDEVAFHNPEERQEWRREYLGYPHPAESAANSPKKGRGSVHTLPDPAKGRENACKTIADTRDGPPGLPKTTHRAILKNPRPAPPLNRPNLP